MLKLRKDLSIKFVIVFAIPLFITIVYFNKNKVVEFDLQTGTSILKDEIFGWTYRSKEINKELKTLASEEGLLSKRSGKLIFNLDSNRILLKEFNYSKNKSIYYDLLNISKIIRNVDIDASEISPLKMRFTVLWNDLKGASGNSPLANPR